MDTRDPNQGQCTGCGMACPLSQPRCDRGFQEAALLSGNNDIDSEPKPREGGAGTSGDERHRSHRGHHGERSHGDRFEPDAETHRRHGGPAHGSGGHHPRNRGGRFGSGPDPHRGHGSGAPGGHPRSRGDRESLSEDERLSRVLYHCARTLVHRERHQGGRASALAVLGSHGEMTQAQLAQKLDIRPASASELLGKMEVDGLVLRHPCAQDGRAHSVRLTEAGEAAAQEVHRQRRTRDESLFAALTPDEKQQLTALLDKLAASLSPHRR